MKYVKDRIPGEGKANRFKLTKETDGLSEYIVLERADEAVEEGTDVDREMLMNIQGFYASSVSFEVGKVTEINADGDVLETTFPEGAIALDTFTQKSTGQTISVLTKTDENGNVIRELV